MRVYVAVVALSYNLSVSENPDLYRLRFLCLIDGCFSTYSGLVFFESFLTEHRLMARKTGALWGHRRKRAAL